MKRIIIFLCLIISAFIGQVESVGAAKEQPLSVKCPTQCAELLACVRENKVTSDKYNVFPPENNALGKCYCKDVAAYQKCLLCKNPTAEYYKDIENIKFKCQEVTGITAAATSSVATSTPTTGAGNNSLNNNNNNNNSNSGKNSTLTDDGNNKENQNKKEKSSNFGIYVIGLVCIAGVAAFIFYTKKQKERPESMPFFGNTASSPNQYATLSSSKEVSTTNLTSDYNSQYYGDTTTAADSNNQYYGQSYDNQNYNQGYNQNYDQGYNQNYDQGYNQDYNSQYPANQYPAGNYENEIAAPQGAPPSSYDAAVPPPVPTTTYESRRESMNPNSHPTVSNITGAYICAYKYDPQLDDELALQVNDQVQIIEEYEDGWMKAVNLTTGKEGMAPRVCIKEA